MRRRKRAELERQTRRGNDSDYDETGDDVRVTDADQLDDLRGALYSLNFNIMYVLIILIYL